MHNTGIINMIMTYLHMIAKSMYILSVSVIFTATMAIGLSGQIPFAAAEEWTISNGLTANNFFGAGPSQEAPAVGTVNAVTKSGTTVNLAYSEFNGFAASNFFGAGLDQDQELSTTYDGFRAYAIQMSAESPTNQDSSSIKLGTTVDLSFATWNGFEVDNFFGQD
ncbi:hypothetical protein MnTg01_01179 [archaeon MnTg01]|nr:hypothetical protein MnTg01_01179 [archaeon MnTg01]